MVPKCLHFKLKHESVMSRSLENTIYRFYQENVWLNRVNHTIVARYGTQKQGYIKSKTDINRT